jgi:hypothetical protein
MSELTVPQHVSPKLNWRAAFARGSYLRRVALLGLLVLCGDFLLWSGFIGISWVVFAVAVVVAAVIAAPTAPGWRRLALLAALLGLALLPFVMNVGLTSFGFLLLGCAYVAASLDAPRVLAWAQLSAALRLLRCIGWRILPDMWGGAADGLATIGRLWGPASLLIWIVPLGMAGVFLMLFTAANPIIAAGLRGFNPFWPIEQLSFWHVIFWLFVAAVVWPFLAAPWRRRVSELAPVQPVSQHRTAAVLLGVPALLRALILFNLMFAVQSMLDASYLWIGRTLPAGMTYADYAHRGAYPLIFTALLSGCFTIAAYRPGSAAMQSKTLRYLVLLWIAQNVTLVISSMRRLYLYVQAYSLTELRFAAFIWMLLVGIGLVLIVMQVSANKSRTWLVRANILALALTLYGSTFIDIQGVIARYDVENCFGLTGHGPKLDIGYMMHLGVSAIPALDYFDAHKNPARPLPYGLDGMFALYDARSRLVDELYVNDTNWRGWEVRWWLLDRYVANRNH